MLKKTITYTDYNDRVRTEDFYFNLSKAEIMDMEMSVEGGLTQMINKITAAQDYNALYKLFTNLIRKAYGEKSEDGKRFIKSEAISDSFTQTEAYSVLLEEFTTDSKAAAEFVNAIIPKIDNKNLEAAK